MTVETLSVGAGRAGLLADLVVRRDDFELRMSFSCGAGSTVAVVGPNGAGKSTMVDALAGLVPLTKGSIVLDGTHMEDLPAERRPVGVCFQSDLLFPRLSALENVAFPLRARGNGRSGAIARARDALARLAPWIDPTVTPGRLSGGERQRVALARALISEPRLLLLDEPLANLDIRNQHEIVALLGRLRHERNVTIMLVAHDLNPLLPVLDGAIYLLDGHPHFGAIGEVVDGDLLTHLYGTPIRVVRTAQGDLFTRSA